MKRVVLALCAAVCAAASMPAAAQFQKPEDAIKYRKAAFTLMGTHMGRLGAMAQGKAPFDAKAAEYNATVLSAVYHLPYAAFGDDTKTGDTRAKPEVWTKAADFKKKADDMRVAVDKLVTASKAGTLDALKVAVGDTGKTCKACHDDYRKE
jgi:cytochrome c556